MRLDRCLSVGLFVACSLLLIGLVGSHHRRLFADGLINALVGRNLRFRQLNQEYISSNNTKAPIRVSLHPSLERVADSRNSKNASDELETPSDDDELETPSNDEEETVAPVEPPIENPVDYPVENPDENPDENPNEASNKTIASESSDNSAASIQRNQSDDNTSPIFIVLVTLSLILVVSLFALLLVTRSKQSAKEESVQDPGSDEFIEHQVSKMPESTPGASILRTANVSVSLSGFNGSPFVRVFPHLFPFPIEIVGSGSRPQGKISFARKPVVS